MASDTRQPGIGPGKVTFTPSEPPPFRPDPRVSVVVTCYNYGHFLESCLESILGQSRQPDELIVVNDGSTDMTARILADYGSRILAITTENRGQAAAFNTGFAATSGDIVLFIDADDRLRPEAVETIAAYWSDDFAVLNFGLETIDVSGRSTGLQSASVNAHQGDNRPRLLKTGTFEFPPTSGNAFSRRFLETTLPMPEHRWRISADCYLIRAAALHGRFANIPQVLGSYRIHGGNIYALPATEVPDLVQHRGNSMDVADALDELALVAGRFADSPDDAAALERALQYRAERIRSELHSSGPARFSDRDRPGRRAQRSASDRLADTDAFRGFARSRWPTRQQLDQWTEVSPGASWLTVPDLLEDVDQSAPVTEIDFVVDPTPYALYAALDVEPEQGPARWAEATLMGDLVWRGLLDAPRRILFPIPKAPWVTQRRISVTIGYEDGASWSSQARPKITGIKLSANPGGRATPYLDTGKARPVAEVLAPALDAEAWQVGIDGSVALRTTQAGLRFAAPAQTACALILILGEQSASGWLSIADGSSQLFTGSVGPASKLEILLPRASAGTVSPQTLEFTFDPIDRLEERRLQVASIGLRPLAVDESVVPPLNIGERVLFGHRQIGERLLTSGWEPASDGEGIWNTKSEIVLTFEQPGGTDDGLLLRLTIEPAFESLPGMRHVIAVTQDGVWLAAVQLEGPGDLDVPLPSVRRATPVSIALHSVMLIDPTEPDAQPAMATFVLRSVELLGKQRTAAAASARPASASQGAALRAMMERVSIGLGRLSGPARDSELAALRKEVSAFLEGCDAKALLILADDPDDLDRLVNLGQSLIHLAPSERLVAARLPTDASAAQHSAVRLRSWLLAILHRPAYAAQLFTGIERLPAPLFWHPDALAAYLGRTPNLHDKAAHAAYRIYLQQLMTDIDAILAVEPVEGAAFRLAAAILRALRSTVTIFDSGVLRDLVRLRSRCIERLLLRSGSRLVDARQPSTPAGRVKLGVLVRDVQPNPEGWALLGMYSCLDRSRFDPMLIRMDENENGLETAGLFSEELCLSGLSVDRSVAEIRALELDLLITGCYVADWEKTSAILAHQLAPVQVWHGAVCPTTGGFRSFNVALTCKATEPTAAERHYTERLEWLDGPLQCAYAFDTHQMPSATDVRREIGVPDDAVMLASGAMAHKITDPLLDCWAQILHEAPDAVLVLYPFAPNWSLAFAPTEFRERVVRRLEERDVDPRRVLLLWTQTPERVREIVSAADLYLDSFPYTGATTVCEALSGGTPALTCAGDSLRELTGASWVRAFGLPELVATSPEHYASVAAGLANDPKELAAVRRKLGETLAAGRPPHLDLEQFGRAFSDALARIAGKAGGASAASLADGQPLPAPIWRAPSEIASPPVANPPPARAGHAPVTVLILASPRTGSTLLCDLINRTPGTLLHYELFHDDMIQFNDRTDFDAVAIRARDADPAGFLDRLYSQAAVEGRSLFGFKHFAHLNPVVARIVASDPKTKLIHVGRSNLLAQYSSEKIAKTTRRWFSHQNDSSVELAKITFRRGEYEHWERYQRRTEMERINMLASFRQQAFFVDYTNVLDVETGDMLSGFLGVSLVDWRLSAFKRQNNPMILDRFTNPDEVAQFFAGRGQLNWTGVG